MTWQETIIRALSYSELPVHRYLAHKKTDRYIVWAEDSETIYFSDDKAEMGEIAGTVDLFTKTEDDDAVILIKEGLELENICYKLNSIQYEDDTGYIHYEWIFEIPEAV